MSKAAKSSESGAVTAEFMLLIPWLMVFLATSIGIFQIGLKQLELTHSAGQIARLVARSDELLLPEEFESVPFDVELMEDAGLVCAELADPVWRFLEARACAPSLGS